MAAVERRQREQVQDADLQADHGDQHEQRRQPLVAASPAFLRDAERAHHRLGREPSGEQALHDVEGVLGHASTSRGRPRRTRRPGVKVLHDGLGAQADRGSPRASLRGVTGDPDDLRRRGSIAKRERAARPTPRTTSSMSGERADRLVPDAQDPVVRPAGPRLRPPGMPGCASCPTRTMGQRRDPCRSFLLAASAVVRIANVLLWRRAAGYPAGDLGLGPDEDRQRGRLPVGHAAGRRWRRSRRPAAAPRAAGARARPRRSRPVEARSRPPRPEPLMKSPVNTAMVSTRVHDRPGQVDEEPLPARPRREVLAVAAACSCPR